MKLYIIMIYITNLNREIDKNDELNMNLIYKIILFK